MAYGILKFFQCINEFIFHVTVRKLTHLFLMLTGSECKALTAAELHSAVRAKYVHGGPVGSILSLTLIENANDSRS